MYQHFSGSPWKKKLEFTDLDKGENLQKKSKCHHAWLLATGAVEQSWQIKVQKLFFFSLFDSEYSIVTCPWLEATDGRHINLFYVYSYSFLLWTVKKVIQLSFFPPLLLWRIFRPHGFSVVSALPVVSATWLWHGSSKVIG